jgi:hypothetical protein
MLNLYSVTPLPRVFHPKVKVYVSSVASAISFWHSPGPVGQASPAHPVLIFRQFFVDTPHPLRTPTPQDRLQAEQATTIPTPLAHRSSRWRGAQLPEHSAIGGLRLQL